MKTKRDILRAYLTNFIVLVLLFVLLAAVVTSGALSRYYTGVLMTIFINIILVTSLNLTTGFLGQIALGHAGFMAIGAYTAALFVKAMEEQAGVVLLNGSSPTAAGILFFLVSLVLGGLVAAAFGFLVGVPALRLKGDYLAIITLGFGEIIRVVLTNIDSVLGFKLTYGAAGLKQVPKISSFTVVFLCVALTCLVIHMVMKSRHGRAILSIRENEIAAESVGINTTYYKVMAFVMSAFFAGIAGCLYAGYLGSLFPSTFKFMKSIEILVMVVLGGMGSMLGSVLSATVLTVISELLRSVGDLRMVFYSLALVLMMIFRPKGLLGSYDFSLSRVLEKGLTAVLRPGGEKTKEKGGAAK